VEILHPSSLQIAKYCMNKTVLQDIQRTLNIIRNQIDGVDAETAWVALELILASSTSVVALAKNMAKPETKTVTRKISISKTKPSNSLLSNGILVVPMMQCLKRLHLFVHKSRYPINKSANKSLKITH
jgi:hypothetical protein